MNFSLPPDVETLRARIAHFVRDRIIPLEADRSSYDEHENIALPVLERIRAEVKERGMWAPQVPQKLGGLGLSVVGRAACYEEMNASIFGPAWPNTPRWMWATRKPEESAVLLIAYEMVFVAGL